MNALYAQGHEIASHAIGHFNGAHWSAAQWQQEFSTYRDIVANGGSFNARAASATLDVPPAKIVGFRAPYLAAGAGLYEALRRDGFRYDTSGISFRTSGRRSAMGFGGSTWRSCGSPGSAARRCRWTTISASPSRAGGPTRGAPRSFKEQMLATYLAYFRASYTGNRAPLNIGHHFEAYQGGVYYEALKEFARRVCGLPEVKCAAYSELADFMDRQSPEMLAAYQRGDFPHAAPPVVTAEASEPVPSLGAPPPPERTSTGCSR